MSQYDPQWSSLRDLFAGLEQDPDEAFRKTVKALAGVRGEGRGPSSVIPDLAEVPELTNPYFNPVPKPLLTRPREKAPDIRAALKGPLAPLVPVLKGMSQEDRAVAIDNIMGNLANAQKNSPVGSYDETNEAVGEVSGASSLGPTKKRLLLEPLDYLEPAGAWTKLGQDKKPLHDRKRAAYKKYDSHQAVVQHQLNPLLEPGVGLVSPAYDAEDVRKAVTPLQEMPPEIAGGKWHEQQAWRVDRARSLWRKLRGTSPEITRQLPDMVPELYEAWAKQQKEQVYGVPEKKKWNSKTKQEEVVPRRVGLFEHAREWQGDPKLAQKAKEALTAWKVAARNRDPVAMELLSHSAHNFLGKPLWNDHETVRPVNEGHLHWATHSLETGKVQAGLVSSGRVYTKMGEFSKRSDLPPILADLPGIMGQLNPLQTYKTEEVPLSAGSKKWKRVFNEDAMESSEEWARRAQESLEYDGKNPALEKHDVNWTEPAKVKDAVRAYAGMPKLRPDIPTPSTKKMYAIKVLSMGQERKGLPPSWHQKTPDEWALNETLRGIKSLSSIKQQAAQGDSVARVLGEVLGAVEDRGSAGWALRQATRGMQPGMIERVEKIIQTLIRHAQ